MGLRFAKWRAAFNLTHDETGQILTPSTTAITENSRILAEYALKCQSAGIVPIVEPELVYDGNYTIEECAETTAKILDSLFLELKNFGINLRACLLKVNMVLAGKQLSHQSTPDEVGRATAEVLKNHVPPELTGVVFLSGGQTPEQATANLAAVKQNGPFPWPVTFSFARALQDPLLYAWRGNNANSAAAKEAFLSRLIANQKALAY
jgi:fructose-bisphosphate aldolase class I